MPATQKISLGVMVGLKMRTWTIVKVRTVRLAAPRGPHAQSSRVLDADLPAGAARKLDYDEQEGQPGPKPKRNGAQSCVLPSEKNAPGVISDLVTSQTSRKGSEMETEIDRSPPGPTYHTSSIPT